MRRVLCFVWCALVLTLCGCGKPAVPAPKPQPPAQTMPAPAPPPAVAPPVAPKPASACPKGGQHVPGKRDARGQLHCAKCGRFM